MNHKVSVTVALCICMAGCGSLKIAMNTRADDGDRIVLTSDKRVAKDTNFALGVKYGENDSIMAILVTYDGRTDHGVFLKGDKMRIRLKDQSVIDLENVYDKEFEEETVVRRSSQLVEDYGYAYSYGPLGHRMYVTPYEVSRFVPYVSEEKISKSYALYLISLNQLNDIIDKGVIKLRIEFEDHELDISDPSKISGMLDEMKTCLADCIVSTKRSEF